MKSIRKNGKIVLALDDRELRILRRELDRWGTASTDPDIRQLIRDLDDAAMKRDPVAALL